MSFYSCAVVDSTVTYNCLLDSGNSIPFVVVSSSFARQANIIPNYYDKLHFVGFGGPTVGHFSSKPHEVQLYFEDGVLLSKVPPSYILVDGNNSPDGAVFQM